MRFSWEPAEVVHLNCTARNPLGGHEPAPKILDCRLREFLQHENVAALAGPPDYDLPIDAAGHEFRCAISHELSPELLQNLGQYTLGWGFRLLEVSQDPRPESDPQDHA